MNSTMVTAIEHHSNQQQPQGSTYSAGTIAGTLQMSNLTNGSARGPKSPSSLHSPNGTIVSPRSGGGGQSKKAAAAAAAAARSLSLQTKLTESHQSSSMLESPLTALSSPGSSLGSALLGRVGQDFRGAKRSLDDYSTPTKVIRVYSNGFPLLFSIDIDMLSFFYFLSS